MDLKDSKILSCSFSFPTLILLSAMLQIYLIFTGTCSVAPSSVLSSHVDGEPCSSGRVYVYDLPPMFNKELLEKCDSLDPWHSRCDEVSNSGFGRRATELVGLLPESLAPAWYWSEQYMLEPIVHSRILEHECRTLEPESATAFYIPFYAGLSIGRYLWHNYTIEDRDRDPIALIKWVQDQPHWKRSYGRDHFITLGRLTWDFRRLKKYEWGSSFINMAAMGNITRLLVERDQMDPLDIGVPFPTGFHPRSDSDVLNWQNFIRQRQRSKLFCFVGGTRGKFANDFRSRLLSYCVNESNSCRAVNCTRNRCASSDSVVLKTFLDSDFCLQPRGDSYSRKSVFDCMVAGSIPVLFWERTAYGQYDWFLPSEPASYSVYIDHKEVRNGSTSIREVLEKYSKEEVRKMREKVIEAIPRIVYASSPKGLESIKDAFDTAFDGVLKRFKEQRLGID